MVKERKKRIIFSNHYSEEDFKAARETAFLNGDWEKAEDIPKEKVWEYYNYQMESEWMLVEDELNSFFAGKTWLLMGTIGRWNGSVEGGFVFRNVGELSRAWEDCDIITIYDTDGHLLINCSHHDGTNFFEVKELTEAGVKYEELHNLETNPRTLHTRLWNSTKYTRLPHFAHKVYGCPKREAV